jgi:alpha-tubulin suppressor-like RCC1 family protein
MPTFYNFRNTPDYAELAFPNLSPAQRIIEHVKIDGQPDYYTYAVDSTQKSPNNTDSVRFTITAAPGGSFYLLDRPSNQALLPPKYGRFISSVPRSFTISFWIKGTTAGTVVFDFRLQAGGSGSGTSNRTLTSSWQYYEITFPMSSNIAVGNFVVPGILFTTPPVNGDIIWLADFKFRDPLDTATTTSFDDQFIPADTFRQGNLFLSGTASSGQLGNNSTTQRSSLVQEFTASSNWRDVSLSFLSTHAIKSNGTLWSWGNNGAGELGINATGDRRTPVQEFTSSTNWIRVASSGDTVSGHVAAIKSDGTLWTWGNNGRGQLGTNDIISRRTPVQEFTSSTNWKYVNCNANTTHAIKTDGTLWLWGSVSLNTSIITPTIFISTPMQEFTSGNNWIKVSANKGGLKSDGTLWAWGGAHPSSSVTSSSPVQVDSTSTWKDFATTRDSTGHAIKTNGTLWSWGRGDGGEMGNNTAAITNESLRREATSSSNWTKVFGGECVAAIKTDGTLWCWGGGFSYAGAIGLGDLTRYSSPVLHTSNIKNWKKVEFHGSNADFGAFLTYIDPII